jgi:hypothetical protein
MDKDKDVIADQKLELAGLQLRVSGRVFGSPDKFDFNALVARHESRYSRLDVATAAHFAALWRSNLQVALTAIQHLLEKSEAQDKDLPRLLQQIGIAVATEKEKPKKRMANVRPQGVERNSERGDDFFTAVKDFAWARKKERPMLKATHIAQEVYQLTHPLNPAERDKRFPTMKGGKPYSKEYILEKTRDALKELSK